MSDAESKASGPCESAAEIGSLLIADLVCYLSRLASLNREPRIGNVALSDGLRQLASVLQPHSRRPIHELADVMREEPLRREDKDSPRKPKAILPTDLDSLSGQEIDRILNDLSFTKAQLIELGSQRFGISRSRLMRLSKGKVTASVRAALNHERSLDVISQEARRGGGKRSS